MKATIGRVLAEAPPARDIGKPRLPIDRVFTLSGIGTVVTGTLRGGTLHKGQRVAVQPGGRSTWIRRMQSHNRDADVSDPGSRVALNLPDVSASEIRRGDVVTLPTLGGAGSVIDVRVEISRRAQRPLRTGVRVRVHYGSGNTGARVVLLDGGELAVGGVDLAQLRLDRPAFVFEGDRLTIREAADRHRVPARRLVLRQRRLHQHARRQVRPQRQVRRVVGHARRGGQGDTALLHEHRARDRR